MNGKDITRPFLTMLYECNEIFLGYQPCHVCSEPTFQGPSWSSLSVLMITTTKMVLKTLVQYRHLTRLLAQEDFIEFSCHKSSRTYMLYEV